MRFSMLVATGILSLSCTVLAQTCNHQNQGPTVQAPYGVNQGPIVQTPYRINQYSVGSPSTNQSACGNNQGNYNQGNYGQSNYHPGSNGNSYWNNARNYHHYPRDHHRRRGNDSRQNHCNH